MTQKDDVEVRTLTFTEIAVRAGYQPGADGRLNLPATQFTADELARAALDCLGGPWKPGMPRIHLTLTGAGPVWAYLVIAHALHGRVARLDYASPNAPSVTVFGHGL